MRNHERKTSTNHSTTPQKPFFDASPDHAFFSTHKPQPTPFFQPQTSTIQAKSATGEEEVQRMPAFDSEVTTNGEVQRKLINSPQHSPVLPIQAKLTIGEPGDKYEQEADRVASQVVEQINTPAPAQSTQGQMVQRQGGEEEESQAKPEITALQPQGENKQELQAKSNLQHGEASTDLTSAINTVRGGGQPLDAGLQRSMGQVMGADFSRVRVHTDTQADQLNRSIQAKAFTTGQDVFFRQGAYEPGSRGGQELIAHELTHVVQQNGGVVMRSPQMQEQLQPHPDKKTPARIVQTQNTQVIQLATDPVGNFASYDAANLQIVSNNTTANPTEAKVLNSGIQGPVSAPQDPGGFATLTHDDYEQMTGTSHPPKRTMYNLDLNWDRDYGNTKRQYTRMHAVNSFLAQNSNVSGNIFSGRQSYNKKHEQRAEGFAKGFVDEQSWQVVAGDTLVNTLNSTDKIGKNAAGKLYYKPGINNNFPVAFVDNSTPIVGNDGAKYSGVNVDKLSSVCVIEYIVKPTYGLNLATVKTSITNSLNPLYQNLNIAPNEDGTPGKTETIDSNGILNTAANALVNTYATSMTIDIINWVFNPNGITANTDVATNAVPWKDNPVRPLINISPDPPQPGAKVEFRFWDSSNRKLTSRPAAFDI
ncbi:eCIS core domain-containing protein [Calothrix sp. NIES-3974]|uniref:eCIS core domain-containing protein n=1 Tax=Calothrix sp. NIES-3974 TaxID=2005462 RepID=UPI000B5F61B8|nr:DUF4157 domain-containing protein [Calothrix sp. NIES-3974]BAZ03820.1 hypothetical protein NIES3974_04500 [Calothrix sp. NIES-3974]